MHPHQSVCLADHLCCHTEKVIRPTPAVSSLVLHVLLDAEADDQGVKVVLSEENLNRQPQSEVEKVHDYRYF